MQLYLEDLPNQFKTWNRTYGKISVGHDVVPYSPIDVVVVDGTQKWSLLDVVTATDHDTGEQIQFKVHILDIPVKSSAGYLINGVRRQFVGLYEMSKGWHFEDFDKKKKGRKIDDLLTARSVKFLPDTSSDRISNYYAIGVNNDEVCINKGNKSVPISIFLKALTGLSFSTLINRIGATNKFLVSAFSHEEPSRVGCIDIAGILFSKSSSKDNTAVENRAAVMQEMSRIVSFVNKFVGEGAIIGSGAERTAEMFNFRNIKNCFLIKPLEVGNRVLAAGTKLVPELLLELDYSPVDILHCCSSDSNKMFVFKKYEVYNFRGLNRGATDTIDQLRAAEVRGDLEYVLSTGEKLTRLPHPTFNTAEIILNVVNLYINYLNGFAINSNVYDMTNQSVIPLEHLLRNIVNESLHSINMKVEELAAQKDNYFSVRNLPLKLAPFDTSALIRRCIETKGKPAPLSNIENSLGPITQDNMMVKDIPIPQGDMVTVQDTQIGRIDPFDAPENKNVGLVHNRAFLSRICNNAQIEAPFVQVSNCKIVSDVVYLSAAAEKDQYIGQWNENFEGELTTARFNGIMVRVPPSKITYLEASCFQHASAARGLSPFMECMSGKRATMSSSQAKQAIAIVGAERPIVNSGAESIVPMGDRATKPFLTAHDLLAEYCSTNQLQFEDVEEAVLKYESFEDDGVERIHVLSFVLNGVSHRLSKHLPNYQPTLQNAVYGFELYTENGLEYRGDDIVFSSLTYDSRKYARNDSINEGALKFGTNAYDTGLALGLNLHVGYMTYEGSVIDDALLLNDRLVTDDRLSSVFVHQEEYEIARLDGKMETFGFLGNKVAEGFGSNGLPLVGTHLPPGSVVINKFVVKLNEDGSADYDSVGYTTNIELPSTVGGQVVSAVVTGGTKATVTIVSLAKVETGDKMAGRYGNKGVVAKIVPNHMMPFDPDTGKAFDIILNPLGIPSRLNVSQVLEVTYAACNKKQGTIAVVTPFQSGFIDKIKADAERLGIKPIRPINPKTGLRTEYAVHVGEIYMYKLVHKASSKIRSIGVTNEVDATFKQPIGTGKSKAKGQAFGELESWCCMSAESYEFLEEVQTVLSEDFDARKLAQERIASQPGPVNLGDCTLKNSNGKHLKMFYKGSGIKVEQDPSDPSQITFEPMTDADIQNLNPMNPITINDAQSSLRNSRIFNDGRYTEEDVWSWMPLGGEILSPYWIEKDKIYKCIVVWVNSANDRWKLSVLRPVDIDRIMTGSLWVKADTEAVPTRWALQQHPDKDCSTGMPALTHLFKEYDLSISEGYYRNQLKNDPTDVGCLQILSRIAGLKESTGLAQFVISCFPIIPIRYRPAPIFASKQQDFDYYYTAIARCAANYQSSQNPDDLAKVYDYIKLFLGIAGKDKVKSIMSNKKNYVDLKQYATDKQSSGRIREMMAKKRTQRSGRSVIIPFDDISIPPTYMGVPYLMLVDLYSWELVSLLKKSWSQVFEDLESEKAKDKLAAVILKNAVVGNEAALTKIAGPTGRNKCKVIKGMIKRFAEQQIVMFGRQPSLHRFGQRAFKVFAVENKPLQLHPLVCAGFNADFDGDTGYVIAPLTLKSCEEIWSTSSVVNAIINPGNGGIIITPSQDILLGLYYATTFANNALHPGEISPVCYGSLKTVLADLELGLILPSQWVALKHKGSHYISTAGRIAFNSLLPGGFTGRAYKDKYNLGIAGDFKSLRYDSIVSGRVSDKDLYVSIDAIVKELHDEYCESESGREQLIDFYQKISEFGFEWSERSGISFNIGDLNESPLIKDFLNSAEKVVAEIDRKFSMGLMTAADRRKAIMSVYSEVRSDSFLKKYLASFDRTNNIFMMFDSKAKGSEDQIMQTCGMLGVLQKTKSDSLEAPITSNYSQGLSSFDMFETSYAARLGLLSTNMETKKPGELTRTLVYSFSGVYISEECCSTDLTPLRVRYDRVSDFMFKDKNGVASTERVELSDIDGVEILDSEAIKWNVNCERKGVVSKEFLDELANSGLPWFDTTIGRVHFDVKFPAFLKKTLLYRTLHDFGFDDLIQRKYISEKTLAQIEDARPRFLDVMLILNCICKDSICSDSYGLKYTPVEPIKIGSFPGFESAQSIGEPSAQLTMNLCNTGGKAGESIGDGISVMMSAIKNGNIKTSSYGLCAPIDGCVELHDRKLVIVGENEEQVEMNITQYQDCLLVRDGSYVTVGQPLTQGSVHPFKSFISSAIRTQNGNRYDTSKSKQKEVIINPSADLVARIRYEIAAFYDYVYSESRIKILGRHFELAAFVQTSHGFVIWSNNPDYVVGKSYFVGELLQAEGVDFSIRIFNASSTMLHNAGPIVASCYQDSYGAIADASWSGKMKERSPLSAVLTGSPIVAKGLSLHNITDEVDYSMLQYVKNPKIVSEVKMVEPLVVFEEFEDIATDSAEIDELLEEIGLGSGAATPSDKEIEEELDSLFAEFERDDSASAGKVGLMNKF